ncbi:MAG TPA: hypothetical protein VH143_35695 [Kofleriaceae bacterium]|jgi:hypothetical protein|nr:hypothetical protein [Kofleriaceae bacterium]
MPAVRFANRAEVEMQRRRALRTFDRKRDLGVNEAGVAAARDRRFDRRRAQAERVPAFD